MEKMSKYCRGCDYAGATSCEYEAITGHIRPCAPGRFCHFAPVPDTSANRHPHMSLEYKAKNWLPLYYRGYSDADMGRMLGYKPGTIRAWRIKLGLPSNLKAKGGVKLT